MKQPCELTLPADLRYTSEHIWIKKEGDQYVAGVTDYAQDQLGEVAFVDVPCVGETLEADAEFGSIESVKSVNALHMPVAGTVLEANPELEESPTLVNVACYGDGWLVKIKPDNPADVDALLDAESYRNQLN